MMDSIGTILRQERERRELSIHDVFEYTKITELNIEALESDRFEAFPNKVYARAFLRDYANFLNLDSAALLQRYEAEWCVPAVQVSVDEPKPVKSGKGWYYVLVVLIIALLAGGYYVWSNYYSGKDAQTTGRVDIPVSDRASEPAQVQTVLPSVNGAQTSNKPSEPANTPDSKLSNKPAAPMPPAPIYSNEMLLSITAKRNVWIRVSIDGKIVFQQELKAGQTKTWKAKSLVKIRSGIINAVDISLNGRKVSLKPINKARVPIGEAVFTKADLPKMAPSSNN